MGNMLRIFFSVIFKPSAKNTKIPRNIDYTTFPNIAWSPNLIFFSHLRSI